MRPKLLALLLIFASACSRQPAPSAAATGGAAPAVAQPAMARPAAAPAIVAAARKSPPVIFIGLDGADWQLLDDYIARGAMPNLARLVHEGTSGVLQTIRPPLSPIVWTTMMTGVSPLEHGILDFVQFNPATGAKEPITADARRVPAVWNMATLAGKRVAQLGLWATYPAEPVNGVSVSDRLFSFLFHESAPPPGIVYPSDRESWAKAAVDRAEHATDFQALHAYFPWLTEAEYRAHADAPDAYAHPISALRRILIETAVYDDLARDVIQRDHPDLTVVYFEGTDSIGHVFAPYAPPKQAAVSPDDYARYHDAPERYFGLIDRQLGEYIKAAEASHAVVMLASDHGFFWKTGRPTALSSNATTTAAKWHRPDGMYVLWGPGVSASPGHQARGGVAQVCATLLALIGAPAAKDGLAPLAGAPHPVEPAVDYASLYHPVVRASGPSGSADTAALAKLRSLGYISSAAGRTPGEGGIRTPDSYNNEGVILKEAGKLQESVPLFEKALAGNANLASALWNLSDVLFGLKQFDRSDELLLKSYENNLPDGNKLLIGRAIGYQRSGEASRSLSLLNRAVRVHADDADLWLFRGRYRVETHDCAGAADDFLKAEQLQPLNAAAFASEGLARLCAGDSPKARAAFARSLDLDPNQPKIREFMNSLGRTP